MRELELDGIHDDGEHVVLRDSDGEQYTLRIDEALRAAVRRDRPALGLIQAAEHGPLRPRDIQAMLRSGRTAEEIAQIAGVGVEHVRRYEGPVLAERAFIAERARGFHVGRGGGPVLGQVVTERLHARQAGEDVRWDAWRRPDGTWTVELVFAAGGREREAHWVVDMTRQSVAAEDDEARWLTDDESERPEETGRARPRLSAVRGRVYDVEADGGVDEDEDEHPVRRGPWRPVRPASRDEHPAAIGEEELDALNARRGLRSVPAPAAGRDGDTPVAHQTGDLGAVWSTFEDPGAADPDAEAVSEYSREALEGALGDADEQDADAAEDQGATDGASEDAESTAGSDDAQTGEGPAASADADSSKGAAAEDADAVDVSQLTPLPGFDQEQSEPVERTRPKRSPRGKRTSMPSWDEIVFGSKND